MKTRLIDRLIAIVIGIFMLAIGLISFVERSSFVDTFNTGIFAALQMNYKSMGILVIFGSILSLVSGVYLISKGCFKSKRGKEQKILQKTDYGHLRISVKAIDNMVRKCVMEYKQIELQDSRVINTKEGMDVWLKISIEQDVNIPLAVNSLQKQIKQYVTSSSGIDVQEVQVEIASTQLRNADISGDAKIEGKSFYLDKNPEEDQLISETLVKEDVQELKEEEGSEAAQSEQDNKNFHQRLFSENQEKTDSEIDTDGDDEAEVSSIEQEEEAE